jgi:hypothetical protein
MGGPLPLLLACLLLVPAAAVRAGEGGPRDDPAPASPEEASGDPDPDTGGAESADPPETDGDGEDDSQPPAGKDGEGEEGFLDPYYDRAHEGGGSSSGGDGCFDSCSGDLLSDLAGLLFSMETTHHAVPCRHGMVRHRLGKGGSPVSLSVEGGMNTAGGGRGILASARFWTPSPFFLGGHFAGLRPEGAPDFSLAYSESGLEVLYDLPVTLSGSGHLLVAWEGARDPLLGGGVGASASVFISELLEADAGYRLSWLEELPLHYWSARFCWNVTFVSAWAGYMVVRNSDGDTADGPVVGLRLRI